MLVLAATLLPLVGCNSRARLLNSSFVNFTSGGIVPLAPGSPSGFILVRVVNNTADPIEFVVTVEREVQASQGNNIVTQTTRETQRLITFPVGKSNEQGVLFDCPVTRVGLGENLNNPTTEPALFIGAVAGGIAGFGIPGNVNPLDARVGNFTCGDTIIFQANTQAGTVGGVEARSYVLSASSQPSQHQIDTFNNARRFLEEQQRNP
jgi:hypothetical protein